MLNSWFASEDDIPSHNPDGSSRIIHTTLTGLTSPHDAVLAKMRGQPQVEQADDGLLREEEQPTVPDATHFTPHDPTAEKDRVVYDPFEGTPIGLLMTAPGPSDLMQQEEHTSPIGPLSSRIGDCGRKLEQWEHLFQVLDLQNELASMHLGMEGVGIGDGKGKAAGKGRGRGKGKGKGDASWERSWGDLTKEWKPQRQATTDTIESDVHEGDEEGVDVTGGDENEIKKAREERYSTMADQFEGRKEAVQAIMIKLDHLSKALTQFHTLQAPDFEFSKTGSRQSSTTPDVTRSKFTPHTSLNTGHSNVPDVHRLRPVLSSISSSRGSLSSDPQVTFEPEALPASLSRCKGTTFEQPIYVNEMEPGKQMHVMDSPDSMKGSVVLPP